MAQQAGRRQGSKEDMNRGERALTISSGIPREIAADRAGGVGKRETESRQAIRQARR